MGDQLGAGVVSEFTSASFGGDVKPSVSCPCRHVKQPMILVGKSVGIDPGVHGLILIFVLSNHVAFSGTPEGCRVPLRRCAK